MSGVNALVILSVLCASFYCTPVNSTELASRAATTLEQTGSDKHATTSQTQTDESNTYYPGCYSRCNDKFYSSSSISTCKQACDKYGDCPFTSLNNCEYNLKDEYIGSISTLCECLCPDYLTATQAFWIIFFITFGGIAISAIIVIVIVCCVCGRKRPRRYVSPAAVPVQSAQVPPSYPPYNAGAAGYQTAGYPPAQQPGYAYPAQNAQPAPGYSPAFYQPQPPAQLPPPL